MEAQPPNAASSMTAQIGSKAVKPGKKQRSKKAKHVGARRPINAPNVDVMDDLVDRGYHSVSVQH